MNRPQSYDVVIAGGGMVGAALACALGGGQLRVAVIEGTPLTRIRPETEVDLRVSAITCASQRLFSAIGAWQPMTAWRVSPFRDMRVWDAAGPGRIHFDSAAIGEPLLGWIIENRVIQYTLLERACALDNVDLLCPRSLSLVTLRDAAAHVQLDNDSAFHTRLLVGADGAGSRVRRLSGITTEGWSYHQKAVVATVSTEEFHAETAWQRFLPTGPLAFLPLHDGRCSIVWSTTPAQADRLLQLNESDFALELAQAFEWRLGAVTKIEARGIFPLRLQHARTYVKPRVALIGDAAHVVHPLAGQGVNLGLMDAAALAEVVLEASTAGRDIGSLKVLRRYERWRRGENLLMLGALDGFNRLFGSTLTPVRLLRNLGLNAADAAAPVKNLLARRAMGLSGDLPRLARGA